MMGSPMSLPPEQAPRARIAKLTAGQRDVLARIAHYKSSKEIARELGISPHTVDQRAKRIQVLLGVDSRFEAARIFVAAEAETPAVPGAAWGDLMYQPSALAEGPRPGEEVSSGARNRPDDRPDILHQAQATYAFPVQHDVGRQPWHMVLLESGSANDLSPWARTVCIGVMTLASVLSLAAVVSLAEGLSRLL